jgi:hypothetical protein
MTEERRIRLRELVRQRFEDISRQEALRTYADGFPFGIAGFGPAPEERAFVESEAKASLGAKLAPDE